MRLFVATPVFLPIYAKIKEEFSEVLEGKFVEGFNLHLTHFFIGEDDENKYKIKIEIPNEKIKLKGFDFFGEKVFFIKANSNNIDKINKIFSNKFFKPKNIFKPHITICRIKRIKDKKKLKELIKKWENFEWEVDFDVYLYSSILTKKGPIYKKIYKY